MTVNSLSLSRLVRATVNLTPANAQAQNLSTLLILGNSAVIDSATRYRRYTDLAAVANDFGTNVPEYAAALLWFQQAPQPTNLWIGRWFKTAGAGSIKGQILSVAQQALAAWNAINSGGFTYTKDGGAPVSVTGLNFSAAASLNQVASIITAGLSGATMIWNSVYQRFELASTTLGATSSVSVLSAPGSGTDISSLLGMTAANTGAYLAQGAAAESALSAVTLFDQNFGQQWYAVSLVATPSDNDHLAVAAYIEAAETRHLYGISTQDSGNATQGNTTAIGPVLKALAYKRTCIQYSSSNAYSVCSLLGRLLTVDYTGNNTAITLAYKQEPGIVAEAISAPVADVLQANNCNAFLAFNNNTAIIMHGVVVSGEFLDTITGTDWLAVTIQNELYNLLYTSTTKIPQTDAGTHLLVTTVEGVCSKGVSNGLGAPGQWNAGGFGPLKQGDFLSKGFMVFAQNIDEQNLSDRAARKAVPIQVAFKLAGAIHSVDVAITVNR